MVYYVNKYIAPNCQQKISWDELDFKTWYLARSKTRSKRQIYSIKMNYPSIKPFEKFLFIEFAAKMSKI